MSNKYEQEIEAIVTEIADSWKNDKTNFVNLKKKYLAVYFNNDENLFNKIIEEKIGYKSISLKEETMPKSGIIKIIQGKN